MVRRLLLLSILFVVGCTKTQPKFDTLDSSRIPQPLYSGKTDHTIQVVDAVNSIAVVGTCDPRTETVLFRIAGYKDWTTATDMADGGVATVDCSGAGTFSFNLPSLNTMKVTTGWNTAASVRFVLEAKASTQVGDSQVSKLHLEYLVPVGTKPGSFLMTSASDRRQTAPSGIHASARVHWRDDPKSASASFQIKHERQ